MTIKEHHFEVFVVVESDDDDNYSIDNPSINLENSATWWEGTVFNCDSDEWEEADGYDDSACDRLYRVLNLPSVIDETMAQFGGDPCVLDEILAYCRKYGLVGS